MTPLLFRLFQTEWGALTRGYDWLGYQREPTGLGIG